MVIDRVLENWNFSQPLIHAVATYLEDHDGENPNTAPKPFCPTTAIYQTIIHQMGQRLREAAILELDSIPDAELRLFAQIELAAALCGLPQLNSITQRRPQRRENTR